MTEMDARWCLLFIGKMFAAATTLIFLGCAWLYFTKGNRQ